jgi:hypothetical protein
MSMDPHAGHDPPLAATTTTQQDLTVAGQRRINLIWEGTQAIIAVLVIGATIYATLRQIPSQEISNAAFLVVGFYFSRTNHEAVGGIGRKPVREQDYRGR